MLVENVLRVKGADVITTGPETLVTAAAGLLYDNRIGIIVVCSEGGRVLGVLSERDIVRAVAHWPDHLSTLQVNQLYTEDPKTCTMKDDAREIMDMMTEGRFRHMPVVEYGNLVGILSIGDLLKYQLQEAGLSGRLSGWAEAY